MGEGSKKTPPQRKWYYCESSLTLNLHGKSRIHVSKSPDMIIKTAALNVIPLTPGLISKTTCAAFLNQFHPFLVRTFGMPLNHSCPMS